MARIDIRAVARGALAVSALVILSPVQAQIGVGTWVKQANPSGAGELIMVVEPCCNGGRRLTYRLGNSGQTMVVESAFDGREVPVLLDGKPSGETMAITLVDPRHTSTVVKMNGKPFGISKATISADGKTINVENEFSDSVGGNQVGKNTEIWVRK